MTTQITILSAVKQPSGDFIVQCAFWLTAPVNNVVPNPNFKSAVPNIDAPTLALLQAGSVIEELWSPNLIPSTTTLAQFKAAAVSAYNAAQTALTATNPPLALVGATYNGTAWSL